MLMLFKDDVGRVGEAAGHSRLGNLRQVTTLDNISSSLNYLLLPSFFLSSSSKYSRSITLISEKAWRAQPSRKRTDRPAEVHLR